LCEKQKDGDKEKMTNEQNVQYGDSAAASRAIHSALSDLDFAPPGHRITKKGPAIWLNGMMTSMPFYEGATLLFTITFTWNIDGTFQSAERTDNV
jgi:hypothetical protein